MAPLLNPSKTMNHTSIVPAFILLLVYFFPAGSSFTHPTEKYQPGDLLFFWTNEKVRHVGIYLEDGDFFHASTSKGVTISNVNEDYWKYRLIVVRRIDHPLTLNELKDAFVQYDLAHYGYGHEGPDRFDCSGLVWRVFKNHDIELPRSTRGQIRLGTVVHKPW